MRLLSYYALLTPLCLILSRPITAQSNRIKDHEKIGWYNVFSTVQFNKKFELHGEYQWRRTQFIREWQQSLIRFGLTYNVSQNVKVRLGYAHVETFAYGLYALNALGKNFTEHRLFQMIQHNSNEGFLGINHRFITEQRFIGQFQYPEQTKEHEYMFVNRVRYLLRLQMPLIRKTIGAKTPYIAASNEVFIGFGKNVRENIFDQNRIMLSIGYQLSEKTRIECGYINQILQLSREIDNKNVFQKNNGFVINAFLTLGGKSSPKI